jgi:beta-galactosidase
MVHQSSAARLQGLDKPILGSLTEIKALSSNHRKAGQRFGYNLNSLLYPGVMEKSTKEQTFTFPIKSGRYRIGRRGRQIKKRVRSAIYQYLAYPML